MVIEAGQKMYAADILNLTFFPKGAILTFSTEAWNNATNPGFKDIWKICDGQNGTPNLVNMFLRGGSSSGAIGGADSNSVILQEANIPSHKHEATGLSVTGLSVSGLSVTSADSEHEHMLSGKTTSVGHEHEIHEPEHKHDFDRTPTGGRIHSGRNNGGAECEDSIGACTMKSTKIGVEIRGDGAHEHSFSSDSRAFMGGAHTHTISGGSITGGTIGGTTASAGSSQAFDVDTVPRYYTVIYIMKVA